MKSVLLAPTGRAAKVLFLHSKKEAMTIHKKIYFQSQAEGQFSYVLGNNLHTNTLFIVDEASMIASESLNNSFSQNHRDLLEDLLRYVYNGKTGKVLLLVIMLSYLQLEVLIVQLWKSNFWKALTAFLLECYN